MRRTAQWLYANVKGLKNTFSTLKSVTVLMCVFVTLTTKAQTYTTVPVTGFTDDIIANGSTFAGSVTATVDAPGGYYFYNQSFTAFGTPIAFLPNSGTLNSLTTPGLTFQLANATGNNSLRLGAINATGTLTFATPTTAGIVYLAVTSGSGTTVVDVVVNFTDGTSQTFTGQSIADWFGITTNNVVRGIGRTSATNLDAANNTATATDPRIYQMALSLNAANYFKPIANISVTKTNATGTGYGHVLAVSVAGACVAPTAQPTALNVTAVSPGQINGTFTAASPASDGYLVVRYATGATPTNPVNGTTYTVGSSLGTGVVVASGAATTFSATGLAPATGYTFYVYAVNSNCVAGPIYQTTSPLSGSQITSTCPTFSGTFSVGPTGTYPSLTAALAAVAGGISGNVILELQPTYISSVETFPIVLDYNPCFGPTKTLVIRPQAGATALSITSSNTAATIDFNAAKYVTIDGRPGGTGTTSQLSIINTATSGVAIRLINDAQNNTITYCDVQGQNTTVPPNPAGTTVSGVIYFGGANAVTQQGNDNNTISNCSIHATAGGNPVYGILAAGSTTSVASYNDNNTITNCNIYDFFSAGSATVGIKLDAGTNAWTISNNSFYQTATRTYTTSNTHRALWITPNGANIANTASGFIITGNFIGGNAPSAAGTTYTVGGTLSNAFLGMDISVGLGTPTSIQNNTITNIALNTTGASVNGTFVGISVVNGHVNVGTTTGNIIGGATGTGSITITPTSASGTAYGIRFSGGTSVTQNCSNNIIGGITINNGSVSTNFIGIGVVGGATITTNVTNNLVGSTTTANSIALTGVGTATSQTLTGIAVTSGASTSIVSGNTVANLTNANTSTGASTQTRGIVVSTGVTSILNNTVRNLSCASTQTNGGASSTVLGIAMTSTSVPAADVIGNTVHTLVANGTSTTAALKLTGLFYSGTTSGQSFISKNLIHSIEVTASNNAATITGVDYATGLGTFTNNMIRLGIRADGTSITNSQIIRGISSNSSSAANNFYFNSIYIGGSGVGTTATDSYGFIRTATSGTYDIRNNIFFNARSNGTTGGKHYTTYYTANTTGITADYNVYYVNGTGGVFAYSGTADVPTYTAGWIASDLHSFFADPLFVTPTGTSATVDLHVTAGTPAEGTGIDIPSVTDDFDGQTRSLFTPVDIGADAGNYGATGLDVGASVLVSPAAFSCYSATQPVIVRVKNFSATTINFATNNVTVNVTGTGPVSYSGTATLTTGTLASGATIDVTVTPTINMTAAGTYVFTATTVLTGDGNALNNSTGTTTIAYQSIGGVYPVGAGQSSNGGFNTLTAAVAAYNAATCFTAPVVFQLTDATYTTAETFPIIINANGAASATNTLTIKPATGVTPAITGSVASGALIRLNGAKYVTIDGSNNGTTTKDLTVTNSSTTTPTGIALISLGFNAGATNNIIKNLNVVTGASTSTNYGIAIGGTTPGSGGADNDNNTIQNNNITVAVVGIYANGNAAASAGGMDNLLVTGNTISNNTTVMPMGIQLGNAVNNTISFNNISVQTSAATGGPVGISLETGFVSSQVVKNNIIKSLATNTGGYGGRGITVGTGLTASNLTIANNFISGVNGTNWSSFANSSSMGIAVGVLGTGTSATTVAGGVNIYYNTVNMSGTYTSATACVTTAVYIGSATNALDIRNNIFVNSLNNTNAAGSKAYSIYSAATNTSFTTIDFNDYYVSGTQGVLGFLGSDLTTLTALQGAFGQNTNSKNVQPLFVSASDLHLLPGLNVLLNAVGTPIAGVTTDIDGDTRNATTPDMGADEFTPPAVDVLASALVAPVTKNCYSNAETVKVSIKNFSATTLDFSVTPVNVILNVTGAVTATQTVTVNTGTLPSGDSLIVTFPTPLNMSTLGIYTFNATTSSPLDLNTSNDAMATVTRTAVAVVAGTISSSTTQICQSGTPVLNLSGSAGGDVQWQEGASVTGPWTNVGTNSFAYAPLTPITTTMFYQAVLTCDANTATATAIQVIVNNPQVLTSAGTSRCGPGTLNLTATASAGATLNWYTAATGGTAIGTGTSFTTPIISATTTYYVAAEFATTPVCASARTAVTATVNPAPAFDVTNNLTVCNNAITTLTVTTPTANFNSYVWSPVSGLFTDAAATVAYTGTSATTLYVKTATPGTYTFIATANNTSTSCQNIDSVKVTVLPATITVVPSPDQLCTSGISVITLSPAASTFGAATYQWSSSTNNVSYTNIGGATSASYTTPNISATTYYKVDIKNSAGQVCTSPYDTVIVNNPQILTTTPAAICGTGTANLSATTNIGATVNWYSAATGGTLLGTGATFTTPSISASTTYYASAQQGGTSSDVGIFPAQFLICGTPASTTLTDQALRFNTTKPVTINSAYVIPVATGTFTVALRQSLSTTNIQTATFTFTAAQVGIPVQIPLGWTIAGNGSYQITNTVGGINRITTLGCGFPFTTTGGGFSIVGSATSSTTGNITTQYNSFFQLNVTEACESPRVAVLATVNTVTSITAQPQPTVSTCAGSNVSFTVAATGTNVTYQWKKGTSAISGATSATYAINNVQVSDAGTYTVDVIGVCGTVTSNTVTLVVSPSNAWLGAVSSDWNDPANWCGPVPTTTTDVIIPSGTTYSPIINSTANVRNITINSGATVTLTPAAAFNIYGNYSNAGTLVANSGFVYFRGATNQTVGALTATNIVVNGAGGITLTGNLTATTLILQNGNVTLGINNLIATGSVNGSVTSHVITNGTGSYIANNIGAGPVIVPVGSDATTYNPIMISNGQNRNYSVRVSTGVAPAIQDATKAINRTWSITPSSGVTSDVSVTLQFANAHGNANFNTGGVVEVGLNQGGLWNIVSPQGGLTPLGPVTDRQVTVQTQSFGSMIITSPGGLNYITSVSPVNPDVSSIAVLPNPVQTNAMLRVISSRSVKMQWRITDVSGRIVATLNSQLFTGTNNITLPTSMMTAGNYFVVGVGERGKTRTVRFIKL